MGGKELRIELFKGKNDNVVIICTHEQYEPYGDPYRRLYNCSAADDLIWHVPSRECGMPFMMMRSYRRFAGGGNGSLRKSRWKSEALLL